MASRKRWQEVYTQQNPLAMPQAIKRHLRNCACSAGESGLHYLWVSLGVEDRGTAMDAENWLNVVDEAASLGVDTLVVSMSVGPHERPELAEICRWASDTHNMRVGVHLSCGTLSEDDVQLLRGLARERFCVFVKRCNVEDVEAKLGGVVRIVEADGLEDGVVQPHCELPQQMAFVSDAGAMYTCGLVAGQDGFFLGNANESRLRDVTCSDHLPHSVPEGTSQGSQRCEGCPPLLEERIRRAFGE